MPDSKLAHYTMQLSTYGWMLTDPKFSAYAMFQGQPLELALIHIPHPAADLLNDTCSAPRWIQLAYWGDEVGLAMKKRRHDWPKPAAPVDESEEPTADE